MTVMWEAQAADGRLEALLAHVLAHADPAAEVYCSDDARVVVIDPTGRGLDAVPAELLARPPHAWPFERVERRPPPGDGPRLRAAAAPTTLDP